MTAIEVEEIGKEEESKDARNEQRGGDVNPSGIKVDLRSKLCHREVYQSNGSQRESTSTDQGPYDHNLPVIRARLEENPGRDENDTEEDCNQT